jgi:hypothetical protein
MKKDEIKSILDANCDVRSSVAGNPNTPVSTLEELKTDANWVVRRNVAGNPNTPVSTLEELKTDADWVVRSSVAGNPNTPVSTIEELKTDAHCDVRSSVAGNPNTPVSTLEELKTDANWVVRRNVAGTNNIVKENYVAIRGTSYFWYKHNTKPSIYTCGCFIGTREKLIARFYSDQSKAPSLRLRLLKKLDDLFENTFNHD